MWSDAKLNSLKIAGKKHTELVSMAPLTASISGNTLNVNNAKPNTCNNSNDHN